MPIPFHALQSAITCIYSSDQNLCLLCRWNLIVAELSHFGHLRSLRCYCATPWDLNRTVVRVGDILWRGEAVFCASGQWHRRRCSTAAACSHCHNSGRLQALAHHPNMATMRRKGTGWRSPPTCLQAIGALRLEQKHASAASAF